MKNIFRHDHIVITILIFVFLGGLSLIPVTCSFMNPVSSAFRDFNIYDVVYSKLREEKNVDTNIVLYNIGNLNRGEITEVLIKINQYKPKVIGMDIFFEKEKDPVVDAQPAAAIHDAENVVLVSKLDEYDENKKVYTKEITSLSFISNGLQHGYANLPNDDELSYRTIREFRPFVKINDTISYAFSSKIMEIYSPDLLSKLFDRNNPVEKINYRGNYKSFYYLDAYSYADPEADFSFMKDKIVLLGFMGPDLTTPSLEDVFFTPLNERYAGKTFPDMYGVVIHANIISMIINRDYVNVMPYWLSFLLAVLLAFSSVKIIAFIKSNIKDWFSGLTKLFILSITVVNLFYSLLILNYFNYQINLNLALASVALATTAIEFYENYIKNFPKLLLKLRSKKYAKV